MSKATMNELAITGTILDNYSGSDNLMIDGTSYAELKENLERREFTFSELEQVAKDSNDMLLLWIMRTVKDEANYRSPGPGSTEEGMYTVESVLRAMERGEEDLRRIVNAFRAI